MNREWIVENFLVSRDKQNRERIPNPAALLQLVGQFTALRLTSERLVRNWLEDPHRYDQWNFYDDSEERLRALLNGPPCAYCTDIPVDPVQGLHCAHQTSVCRACLMVYFRNLKFTRPCGRRFEDGTFCTEPTTFRISTLNPARSVHRNTDFCEHGFVFRFSECDSLEFPCFYHGCTKLCTLNSLHPPPLHEPDEPLVLD